MEISCVTRTSAAEEKSATIFIALVPVRGRAAATQQEPLTAMPSPHGQADCGSFAGR
jgi:hypothetical protein